MNITPFPAHLPDPKSIQQSWSEGDKKSINASLFKIMESLGRVLEDSNIEDLGNQGPYYTGFRLYYNILLLEYLLDNPSAFQKSKIIDKVHALIFRSFAIHSLASDIIVMVASNYKTSTAANLSALNNLIETARPSKSSRSLAASILIDAPATPLKKNQETQTEKTDTNAKKRPQDLEEEKEEGAPLKKLCVKHASEASISSTKTVLALEETDKEGILKCLKTLCEMSCQYESTSFSTSHVVTTIDSNDPKRVRLEIYLRALFLELHLNNEKLFRKSDKLIDNFPSLLEELDLEMNNTILGDFLHLTEFGTLGFNESSSSRFAQSLELLNALKYYGITNESIFLRWTSKLYEKSPSLLENALGSMEERHRETICRHALRIIDQEIPEKQEKLKDLKQTLLKLKPETTNTDGSIEYSLPGLAQEMP